MTERQNNNQNPSGIWQGIWANLIIEFNVQMTSGNYLAAWETMKLITIEIPFECQKDIENHYKNTVKIMSKPVSSYSYVMGVNSKKQQIYMEAPESLQKLMAEVIKSLYDRKWINRPDFNAQPKFEKKGHL